MVQQETRVEEEELGLPIGAILATAAAAAVVAFMVRRARRMEEERLATPAAVAASAWERARSMDIPARTASATREFLGEKLLPELKPVLIEVLHDVKGYVDQGFKRAEKAIKDM